MLSLLKHGSFFNLGLLSSHSRLHLSSGEVRVLAFKIISKCGFWKACLFRHSSPGESQGAPSSWTFVWRCQDLTQWRTSILSAFGVIVMESKAETIPVTDVAVLLRHSSSLYLRCCVLWFCNQICILDHGLLASMASHSLGFCLGQCLGLGSTLCYFTGISFGGERFLLRFREGTSPEFHRDGWPKWAAALGAQDPQALSGSHMSFYPPSFSLCSSFKTLEVSEETRGRWPLSPSADVTWCSQKTLHAAWLLVFSALTYGPHPSSGKLLFATDGGHYRKWQPMEMQSCKLQLTHLQDNPTSKVQGSWRKKGWNVFES